MKIAIATNFNKAVFGYSLSSIVIDQAIMLRRYGHDVSVITNTPFNLEASDLPPQFPKESLASILPNVKLTDYKRAEDISPEHQEASDRIAQILLDYLKDFDFVFTHDWVFTGWNLPYAQALLKIKYDLKKTRFLHWIHSVPSGGRNWWVGDRYGEAHKLVFPNKTDVQRIADQFLCSRNRVVVIPHIKDLRTFAEFHEDTWAFLDEYPALMQAQITQVYPASTDRLTAKRLKEVILLFSYLKQAGNTVCLVCANQHATGRQRAEDVSYYEKIAKRCDLIPGEEFIFTSRFQHPRFATGIPRRFLRELQMLGNIFFFPTREESFGLVLPEACLMGGCLPILNKSLHMMFEVGGFRGLYVDMGSYTQELNLADEGAYFKHLSNLVMDRLIYDECVQARTFHRVSWNMDSIYQRYYEPIMEGAALWI